MIQVFVDAMPATGQEATVTGDEHHYLTRAVRSRPGDPVLLADGKGNLARASFVAADGSQARLRMEESLPADEPEPIGLWLVPPKGNALEDALDHAAQLGVASVTLLKAERCLANFDGAALRPERLQRVLRESCRQSNRGRIPALRVGLPWLEVLTLAGRGWLASERGGQPLRKAAGLAGPCQVLVGPEGGLSDGEHAAALSAGWLPVTLGPKLYRVPTAVAAMISGIKTLWSPA